MRIRAVLCDIDGVLLNSIPPALEIVKTILISQGVEWTEKREEEFRKIAGFRLTEYFTVLFPNQSFEQARASWRVIQQQIIPSTIPAFPYATRAIRSLKKLKLLVVLATNRQAASFPDHAGSHPPWLDLADAIQTLGKRSPKLHPRHLTTKWAKPNGKALHPAIQWLKMRGVPKHEIVFVGDSLADLIAAYENHLRFIGVLTGTIDTQERWILWAREYNISLATENIIPSIREFPEWIQHQ
ncbi:MAG: hypothetical protein A2806_01800 [Candidatus Terrybacteria bacterium RIFCSPHIGHO2_01_FULL_48_17]|uniref:HAD family hydrolase n=1 Tax=Candidatus Terrybacteria bacterium RIFCSPHIGHO2_01_FULL_48_17 TaxID=1802362 RepID=A0A1G2PL64_9BACT|nr:MAG: hypothetical protein A2806_01800 [Candidatus Terrybacteria bacterium RIFCSPHIGHO2_01_FULL_48_17]OHA52658.1 MAG: hypothetical protein A3A30_03495 [Candidatus Terrybacteria bacterium RIFCSPLOWO2_01_FULL_48_14]